jgi:hypothetical protein
MFISREWFVVSSRFNVLTNSFRPTPVVFQNTDIILGNRLYLKHFGLQWLLIWVWRVHRCNFACRYQQQFKFLLMRRFIVCVLEKTDTNYFIWLWTHWKTLLSGIWKYLTWWIILFLVNRSLCNIRQIILLKLLWVLKMMIRLYRLSITI